MQNRNRIEIQNKFRNGNKFEKRIKCDFNLEISLETRMHFKMESTVKMQFQSKLCSKKKMNQKLFYK